MSSKITSYSSINITMEQGLAELSCVPIFDEISVSSVLLEKTSFHKSLAVILMGKYVFKYPEYYIVNQKFSENVQLKNR
jgi:hypothetical protein